MAKAKRAVQISELSHSLSIQCPTEERDSLRERSMRLGVSRVNPSSWIRFPRSDWALALLNIGFGRKWTTLEAGGEITDHLFLATERMLTTG